MSRQFAFVAALLLGWGCWNGLRAQDPQGAKAQPPAGDASLSREAQIEAALERPITLAVEEMSFAKFVDHVKELSGVDIALDQKGLADAAVDSNTVITYHCKDRRLGSALDLLLDDFELTYVIQYDVLRITSKEKADGILTMRVYPVGDLVVRDGQRIPNYAQLISAIEDTILPDSWDTNAGIGSIKPVNGKGDLAFVISNTRRVHAEIAQLLAALRSVKPVDGVAGRNARDPKAIYTESYKLGPVSGPELSQAISASIAPDSLAPNGGTGQIFVVPAGQKKGAAKASDETKSDGAQQWVLIVSQTENVHRQIEDLVVRLDRTVGDDHRKTPKTVLGMGGGGGMGGWQPQVPAAVAPAAAPVPATATESAK